MVKDELEKAGHEVAVFDQREDELASPGLDFTAGSEKLQRLIREADGIILNTPEYFGGYSSVTKRAIESSGFPSALKGKRKCLDGDVEKMIRSHAGIIAEYFQTGSR